MYLNYRKRQRLLRFERQLPDTLTLLASSLRAGFSLMQGLEAVASEIADPMRRELQRVFTEVRLGRSVEDALGDAAARMESRDLEWAVMAIRIQREVGGNLAELLDTVADTMVKRERVRRELRALTAEGRMSAIVLSIISPVLGLGDLDRATDVSAPPVPRRARRLRPDRRRGLVDRWLVLVAPDRRHRDLRGTR